MGGLLGGGGSAPKVPKAPEPPKIGDEEAQTAAAKLRRRRQASRTVLTSGRGVLK